MDVVYALAMIITLLALNLALMFILWVELRWHSRQREELTTMLMMALFRMSKRGREALEAAMHQRGALGDGRSSENSDEERGSSDEQGD